MADDTESDTRKPAAKPRTPRRRSTSAVATPRKQRKASSEGETSAAKASPATRAKSTTPPKPRSTKRATPAPKTRASAKPVAEGTAAKSGGKWGTAAVVGGLAAVGAAATAALLSLRGSTPKDAKARMPQDLAHAPDGSDASKSFSAGIADENTIPDKM